MKFTENLNDAFNIQVAHEFRNEQIYISIASYFDKLQLNNIAKYFYNQAKHENEHGYKFVEYINSRLGGNYQYNQIIGFVNYDDIESIVNAYVLTETETTANIEALYELAQDEKSYIDIPFISGMLAEQVEEENSAEEFKLKILNCKDIVLFDAELEV